MLAELSSCRALLRCILAAFVIWAAAPGVGAAHAQDVDEDGLPIARQAPEPEPFQPPEPEPESFQEPDRFDPRSFREAPGRTPGTARDAPPLPAPELQQGPSATGNAADAGNMAQAGPLPEANQSSQSAPPGNVQDGNAAAGHPEPAQDWPASRYSVFIPWWVLGAAIGVITVLVAAGAAVGSLTSDRAYERTRAERRARAAERMLADTPEQAETQGQPPEPHVTCECELDSPSVDGGALTLHPPDLSVRAETSFGTPAVAGDPVIETGENRDV